MDWLKGARTATYILNSFVELPAAVHSIVCPPLSLQVFARSSRKP
jgi:hypothetical protein